MSNFHVGQKVVCVNDRKPTITPPTGARLVGDMDGLTKGNVYTVRDIFFDEGWGAVSVRLVEIERPLSRVDGVWFEGGFAPERFRPLITRETNMAMFHSLLTPSKQPVTA